MKNLISTIHMKAEFFFWGGGEHQWYDRNMKPVRYDDVKRFYKKIKHALR